MWMAILNFFVFCVILTLIFAFIKFLFDNFIVSRLISIGLSGYLIYMTTTIPEAERIEHILLYVLLSVLAWLFFRGGASVFDLHETGWVFIFMDGHEEIETAGGFIRHFIRSAICFGLIYFFIGASLPAIHYIAPAIIILLDIATLFMAFL